MTSRDELLQPQTTDTEAEAGYRQHRFVTPPGATELLLIRHGESQPAFPGPPFPLTDGRAGDPGRARRRRAGTAGGGPAGHPAHRRDLRHPPQADRADGRAAGPPARLLVPNVERQLREVGLGDWEGGLYRKRVAENGPLVQRMLAEGRWDVIPGAEPAEEFAARVRDAIERLAAAHPDQRLAVVTHGGVIGQVMALASGSRVFAFIGADNGSISHLVVRGSHWTVRGFNDTAHLDSGLNARVPAAS